MPIDPKEQLKELLRELFQLDKTDLDFGIYRIMNLRSADVEDFIDNKLPATLKTVTDKLTEKGRGETNSAFEEAKGKLLAHISNAGADSSTNDFINIFCAKNENAPVVKKYIEAKSAVSNISHSLDLERDIYNDLYRFFNRYYDEGDFITKPRAGEHTYMIPYNGEEVKFYWANRDQYYIKTGENFRNYVFTNNEMDAGAKVTVEFRLIDAETATNNNQNKKGRVFIPTADYFDWNAENRKLTVKFYYKVPNDAEKETWGEKQTVKADNKGINEKLVFRAMDEQIRATTDAHLIRFWDVEKTIKVKGKDAEINNFYYHLNRYTTTNSFDYFIHKDLRSFLLQELDYFLKHEIFSLNFIAPEFSEEQTNKSIKENILRASAIRSISVDLIDFLAELENFQKMLFEKKKFVVQSDYCLTLDLIAADLIDEIVEFIRTDAEQKQLLEWQKLGFIDALDLDAERIKADKYLVLDTQFLSKELKFKLLAGIEDLDEKTGGLLINSDNFQALNFLLGKYEGKIKCVYIDPPYNTGNDEFIYKDNYTHSSWLTMMENRLNLANELMNEESAIFTSIDSVENSRLRFLLNSIFPEGFRNEIVVSRVKKNIQETSQVRGMNWGHNYLLFFGKPNLVINPPTRTQIKAERWHAFDAPGIRPTMEYEIFDTKPPNGRHWMYEEAKAKDMLSKNQLRKSPRGTIQYLIPASDKTLLDTNWTDLIESGSQWEFTNGEKNIELIKRILLMFDGENVFLDYFAGSGTTGHAVINLNRADDGNRKYILVEMGEYFDTVTKPRIQKVVYSADWKNGKPVRDNKPLLDSASNGISHIFQYIKLEQYEDSLNNIEFDASLDAAKLVFTDQIKYVLQRGTRNSASMLAIGKLANPFNYEMEIIRLNERRLTKIDLVTTFNFLLGLQVSRYRTFEHQARQYQVIHGKRGQQAFIIIWRHFTDDLNMATERDWLTAQDWYSTDALIYTNADNAFGAKSIEAEFKKRI